MSRSTETANTASIVEGVYSLLLTPFAETGEIDYVIYESYVAWQLSKQPQALFAACGSSELRHLAQEERLKLARLAVKQGNEHRIPVVATANAKQHPADHHEELRRMADTGVSALVVIPPNGYGHHPEQLYDYFAELATISPLPLILYEFPGVSPHFIPPDIYGRLATEYGVKGIKDTTSTYEGVTAKINIAPNNIVLQANTAFLVDAIHAGAKGIMAITSTAQADLNIHLWNRLQAGATIHDEHVQLLHHELVCLDALLSKGFTATAKHLVSLQGIPFPITTRSGSTISASTAKALQIWHETLTRRGLV